MKSKAITVSLKDFFAAVFGDLGEGEHVCLALAVPKRDGSGITMRQVVATPKQIETIEKAPGEWYANVSTVSVSGDRVRRRKQDCLNACVLMLDDIGTKAKAPDIAPSAVLETSESNTQWLLFLQPLDVTDPANLEYFEACNRAICAAGYGDVGSKGVTRVFRIPGSVNTKPGRGEWQTRVLEWHPDRVYSLAEVMETLGLEPQYSKKPKNKAPMPPHVTVPDGFNDPVLKWLADQGRYNGSGADGWHEIECPWADEHTDGRTGAYYTPPGEGDQPHMRGFRYFHAHCERRNVMHYLAWIKARGGPSVEVEAEREFDLSRLKEKLEKRNGAGPFLTADEKADLFHASLPPLHTIELPDCSVTNEGYASKTQKPTRANVRYVVKTYGIVLRFNMMLRDLDLEFADPQIQQFVDSKDDVHRAIIDGCHKLGISGKEDIIGNINELGSKNPYHPMEEWIKSVEWDGISRLDELAASVVVEEQYRDIWPKYLRRWLIQSVQAVCGWRKTQQMSGVLTLRGPQGTLKTTWLSSLVPREFWLEGKQLDLKNKSVDSIMEATSRPIVELGELDTTFKQSETGALKALISKSTDLYRAPYDKRAMSWPRCTSFCATVNSIDFLRDASGSRRFWPVATVSCNPDHGIDIHQLWAEAYALWEAGEAWWLTTEEDAVREQQSDDFRTIGEAEELARQWLTTRNADYQAMNRTDFCKLIGVAPSNQNLSIVLNEMVKRLGPSKRQINKVQNAWMVPTTIKTETSKRDADVNENVTPFNTSRRRKKSSDQ